MPLSDRTIQKFIRESLVTGTPLCLTEEDLLAYALVLGRDGEAG